MYQEITVDLGRGLRVGGVIYNRATLREQTVADLLEGERATNQVEQGLILLGRQIVRLEGDGQAIQGPVEVSMLRPLTVNDMVKMTSALKALEADEKNDSSRPGGGF